MADVKWIKIVTDIFDDEKVLLIESMPEADAVIVIWFKLLCLAGKQNNSGVFLMNNRIAYTDEMFSTIFRRPINTVRMALQTFEKFGMIEIIDGVITIPNWSKHQSLDKLEKSREYMRNYMNERRKKQKALCDLNSKDEDSESKEECKTNSKTNNKTNVNTAEKNREEKNREEKKIISNDIIESDFEELWKLYPNKQGKSEAFKKYQKLVKEKKTTKQQVADGIQRYCEYIKLNKTDKKYIKHGSTFFNQECWNDVYDTPKAETQVYNENFDLEAFARSNGYGV